MRPSRKPADPRPSWHQGLTHLDRGTDLPADIAFLLTYRSASLAALRSAESRARHLGVPAHVCLIADRGISELLYYQALAAHLGLPFVQGPQRFAADAMPDLAIRRGYAKLAEGPARWLLAPTGAGVLALLTRRALGRPMRGVLITTPTRFSALVRRANGAAVADAASNALPRRHPDLSAKDAVGAKVALVCSAVILALVAGCIAASTFVAMITGGLFFAVIAFRLLLCAAGCLPGDSEPERLTDAQLPFYSVLVPLRAEAGIVEGLVANLNRLDYPSAKLEIKLIVEEADSATQVACLAARLGPQYEVVVAPRGDPMTKPRALNVALAVLKGQLVTVYDAEDAPAPDQLRKAAARFHQAPQLACLQARLVIDRDARLLSQLFGIEYAALFGLFNPGLAIAGWPMALGGTSNHFRRSVLTEIGGWDAWNVAEDADLGLRLARFGYRTEILASATRENAPPDLGNWFRQRRRWTKGWMQTAAVLGRRPLKVAKELGAGKSAALALMLMMLVLGPLATLPVTVFALCRLLASGLPNPHGAFETLSATLWSFVFVAGPLTTLWTGYAGAKACGAKVPAHALMCIVPYQALISVAAWGGLFDLCRNPYHWHKTHHDAVPTADPRADTGRPARSGRPRQDRLVISPCGPSARRIWRRAEPCGPLRPR